MNDCERIPIEEVETGKWTEIASMKIAKKEFAVLTSTAHKVIIAIDGESTKMEIYDPQTNRWTYMEQN